MKIIIENYKRLKRGFVRKFCQITEEFNFLDDMRENSISFFKLT